MDLTPDMQSLLKKLDALDLTEGERTAFGQLLLGDEDVEGFTYQKIAMTVQGFNLGVVLEKNSFKNSDGILAEVDRRVVDHKADD